jgi:hypothetical protein
MRLAQFLLRLSAPVEDGAVSAGAEHVQMHGALTALALCPQLVEVCF